MYVPYSNYRLTYDAKSADITKPNHLNPDLVRWELHRVWVVEATLKEGKRHIYSKRVFYLDEDSWLGAGLRPVRRRGQLYRASFAYPSYSYDVQAQFGDTHGDLRLQLRALQHHRPVRPVRRPQVPDRDADRKLLVARRAGRRRRVAERDTPFSTTRSPRSGAQSGAAAERSRPCAIMTAIRGSLDRARRRAGGARRRRRAVRGFRRPARHAGADVAAREK